MTANVTQHYALKNNKTVLLLEKDGQIPSNHDAVSGLFKEDTRIVRSFAFKANGQYPVLKKVAQLKPNLISFEYSLPAEGGDIQLTRSILLKNDNVFEEWTVKNNGDSKADVKLDIEFATGYNDIFDVRDDNIRSLDHDQKPRRGQIISTNTKGSEYSEVWKFDKSQREIKTLFETTIQKDLAKLDFGHKITLAGREKQIFYVRFGNAEYNPQTPLPDLYKKLYAEAIQAKSPIGPHLTSEDKDLHAALQASQDNISALLTTYETGLYPHAGLPWFSCPFGRDALVTSLLLIEYAPELAKSVLLFQAKHQATEKNEFQQSEPGKIFHEMRFGETSFLKENPFSLYYGGVDTTPLFVLTANEYFEKTKDKKFIEDIWPNLKAALNWICQNMDQNGGYLRYAYDPNGLTQQGWKDSGDSVFDPKNPDKIAKDPIALCEVQAYAHAALSAGAKFAKAQGNEGLASDLKARAENLKTSFNRDFWMADNNCYALALDGEDKRINVVTTNAGHCLLTDIVPPERQKKLVKRLMKKDIFSGFGLRTLAKGPGYEPESYHRGSVWPHDTALVAMGIHKKGFDQESADLAEALFNIIKHTKNMPELISGQARKGNQPPKPYQASCLVQAWSAAAFISLAMSNFEHTPKQNNTLHFKRPKPHPHSVKNFNF